MKLGNRQRGCLDGLKEFGLWKTGYCRWQWSTPSATQDIMESLVKHGLVTKTQETFEVDGYETAVYRLTERKPAVMKERPSASIQRKAITAAEKALGVGPVGLARLIRTPYHTLKDWKSGRTAMPGVAYVALAQLIKAKSRQPAPE